MTARARSAATAVAAGVLFVLTNLVLCRTHRGQRLDAAAFSLVLQDTPIAVRQVLDLLARPVLVVVLAATVVVLAARSLRPAPRRVAVAVLALLAVPLARVVRTSWTRPDLGVPGYLDNTFPSTHAAAGFALLVGCLVLWPRPLRRIEGWAAAAITVVFLLGNLTWYAHRPADVVGSALLAVCVAALAAAAASEPLLRLAPLVADSPSATGDDRRRER